MELDRSLPAQFVGFLGHVVDGTLGHQCKNGDPGGPTVAARATRNVFVPAAIAVASAAIPPLPYCAY